MGVTCKSCRYCVNDMVGRHRDGRQAKHRSKNIFDVDLRDGRQQILYRCDNFHSDHYYSLLNIRTNGDILNRVVCSGCELYERGRPYKTVDGS